MLISSTLADTRNKKTPQFIELVQASRDHACAIIIMVKKEKGDSYNGIVTDSKL